LWEGGGGKRNYIEKTLKTVSQIFSKRKEKFGGGKKNHLHVIIASLQSHCPLAYWDRRAIV
jgi:hypothetical protein